MLYGHWDSREVKLEGEYEDEGGRRVGMHEMPRSMRDIMTNRSWRTPSQRRHIVTLIAKKVALFLVRFGVLHLLYSCLSIWYDTI